MGGKNTIISSTVSVTLVTFVIKFLGLVKQSVIASCCGATYETDAFFIATGVIMSLSAMIFSALSISLLTMHTNVLVKDGRTKANDLINSVLRLWLPISIAITLLFCLGANFVAKFLAPSYSPNQLELLAHYIRLMSIIFILTCYYLSINVILETDKEFIPGRCQGLFQNVFLIVAAVLLFGEFGMESLIWGFILSGIAECVLVTWCARKRFKFIVGFLATPKSEMKRLLNLSLPLIMGSALYEINDIVDKQISSGLGKGNVSFLTYGSTINEIVTGVIVSSVSVVLFSHFATWVANGELEKLQEKLNQGIVYLTVIILPIMSLCLVAGDDILKVLYGRGNFGNVAISTTTYVVIGYALGFVFASARANLVKVYYAFQDTKTPLLNGLVSIFINILCSIVLSKHIGVGGIALATSIAMLFSSLMLYISLKKHIPNYSFKKCHFELVKAFSAFVIISVCLYIVHDTNFVFGCFSKLLFEVIISIGLYILLLYILQSKSVDSVLVFVKKRRWKN